MDENILNEEEIASETPAKKTQDIEMAWYVINTFTKHEAQVKDRLEKRAETFNMCDKIQRIVVADYQEQVLDKETGKPKMKKNKETGKMEPVFKTKNYYPGYIFVEMVMDDDAWFIVRNTEGVSGITGSSGKGTKPFPVPREEMEKVLKRLKIEDESIYSEYKVGDIVKILNGTFTDAEGEIIAINEENHTAQIQIVMFGRPATIEQKFSDIERAPDTPNYIG